MIAAILGAYVIGAIPIGWMIARALGVGDIRRHGSGTIGATNVLRTLGWLPAIVTLLGDVAKGGAAVVLAARLAAGDPTAVAAAAAAAVAGNCWSVFLGFRGGKGVATGLGALLTLMPWATLAALPVFIVIVASFRYVSLGSLLATVCVPLGAAVLGYPRASVLASLVVAIIIVGRHHANIGRLLSGTESRIGQRSPA